MGKEGTKQELHAIFILGAIVAGREAGFEVPSAGEDLAWMKANAEQFQQKANAGNIDMQGLVDDIKTRPEFSGVL